MELLEQQGVHAHVHELLCSITPHTGRVKCSIGCWSKMTAHLTLSCISQDLQQYVRQPKTYAQLMLGFPQFSNKEETVA